MRGDARNTRTKYSLREPSAPRLIQTWRISKRSSGSSRGPRLTSLDHHLLLQKHLTPFLSSSVLVKKCSLMTLIRWMSQWTLAHHPPPCLVKSIFCQMNPTSLSGLSSSIVPVLSVKRPMLYTMTDMERIVTLNVLCATMASSLVMLYHRGTRYTRIHHRMSRINYALFI